MSLPSRTESFNNGSFAFTSVVVSSETSFSEFNSLLSLDGVDPEINEPSNAAEEKPIRGSRMQAPAEKIYRLDQAKESLTPNLEVLRQKRLRVSEIEIGGRQYRRCKNQSRTATCSNV